MSRILRIFNCFCINDAPAFAQLSVCYVLLIDKDSKTYVHTYYTYVMEWEQHTTQTCFASTSA